jgi:hypothetical protein
MKRKDVMMMIPMRTMRSRGVGRETKLMMG